MKKSMKDEAAQRNVMKVVKEIDELKNTSEAIAEGDA